MSRDELTDIIASNRNEYADKTADRILAAGYRKVAVPHVLRGDVEWTVFRASDGPNGSPAENLRYSTKAGAQESIDTRYGTPELWEPRRRFVGEWTK